VPHSIARHEARSAWDWEGFLHEWSREILGDSEKVGQIPQVAIHPQRERIGYPPATPEQIAETEERLGLVLPHSYKSFLFTTDGWPCGGSWVDHLLPAEQIDRFAEMSKDWLENWRLGVKYAGGLPPIDDRDYKVYGPHQNPLLVRDDYLEATIQISQGDIGVYLLNPLVQFDKGEWEAWMFESETGARRYKSFWELMHAEYDRYLELRDI
jgi:hypothetical protein